MGTFKHLSPREAWAAYIKGSGILVDVRERDEATTSVDVKQLYKVPFSELEQRLSELPNNRTVVFLSRVGNKGSDAARLLLKKGFSDVAVMEGGLTAWESEGLPVKG